MPKREPGLYLDPVGNDFMLRRTDANGKTRRMLLDEEDVLKLAQSARRLRDHILARRSPRGDTVSPEVVTPVTRVRLAIDALATHVLLWMIDPADVEICFALPLNVARALADRLPERVAQVEAAARTNSEH
jgi:hypothetical protein